jgi:hypothetical protein
MELYYTVYVKVRQIYQPHPDPDNTVQAPVPISLKSTPAPPKKWVYGNK